jgi:hypothetical protein
MAPRQYNKRPPRIDPTSQLVTMARLQEIMHAELAQFHMYLFDSGVLTREGHERAAAAMRAREEAARANGSPQEQIAGAIAPKQPERIEVYDANGILVH